MTITALFDVDDYAQCYCTCSEKPVILLPVGNQTANSNSAYLTSYMGIEILTLEQRFMLLPTDFSLHMHFSTIFLLHAKVLVTDTE